MSEDCQSTCSCVRVIVRCVKQDIASVIIRVLLNRFRENVKKKQERGAAFAVYYKGQLVVDLWGGYADYQALRLRRSDSTSMAYSATKVVTAICLARLYDRFSQKSLHWYCPCVLMYLMDIRMKTLLMLSTYKIFSWASLETEKSFSDALTFDFFCLLRCFTEVFSITTVLWQSIGRNLDRTAKTKYPLKRFWAIESVSSRSAFHIRN